MATTYSASNPYARQLAAQSRGSQSNARSQMLQSQARAWERAHQRNVSASNAAKANTASTTVTAQTVPTSPAVESALTTLGNIDKSRYVNQYNQYAQKTNATRDAYLKQLENRYANDQANTNATYDQAARQNYITYRQGQKNLAGELNSLGIRGGASESAAVRMNNAYGNNVATNDAARQTALAQLAQNYADTTADYNRDIDNQLAQAYATALENQSKYEDEQRELARQEAIRQQTLARELEEREYERARYANEKELEQYSATLERFTSEKSVNKAIDKLDSSDPNYTAKLQLLQLRLAQLKGGGKSGGGGGGGSRRRSGGGSGGGGGNNNSKSGSSSSSTTYGPYLSKTQKGAIAVKNAAKKAVSNTKKSTKKTTKKKTTKYKGHAR